LTTKDEAAREGSIVATAAPLSDPASAELMARVQRGDEGAFASLMEHWELPVKSVIARLVLNASEAEELAQETFVRVWQQREKFRTGAEFRPWLFAIAVNLARNRLRWWRRRPTVSLDQWTEAAGDMAMPGGSEARIADARQQTGAGALEQSERAAAVRDAIAALPVDLREAIVLFEYEQMSHAEIADVVGATPKAIETRIYRAREKLRAALKRWV
jgi:RNA polymerase sigma factor (sigma-70 family)